MASSSSFWYCSAMRVRRRLIVWDREVSEIAVDG